MGKTKFVGGDTCGDQNSLDIFASPFNTDADRIKKVSAEYKKVGIAKAFSLYYGLTLSNEIKQNRQINNISVLEVGKIYTGTVRGIENGNIEIFYPGCKEDIVCKESFASCIDSINNYLLTHDNKIMFELREKKQDTYYVSIINAYYKTWVNMINKAIDHEDCIEVHLEELVKGGYTGTTPITPLVQLTGKDYVSSIFVPGSHIVLNIERNFEQWVGENIYIVPQKFVEFKKDLATGLVENCLVGSRKRRLQIIGMQNTYEMYKDMENAIKLAEFAGKTEIERPVYEGIVTGVINSKEKTGVFVEVTEKFITGLLPIDSYDLLDYKPGDVVNVYVNEFEVQKGRDPFVLNKNGQVLKCNVRPIFGKA